MAFFSSVPLLVNGVSFKWMKWGQRPKELKRNDENEEKILRQKKSQPNKVWWTKRYWICNKCRKKGYSCGYIFSLLILLLFFVIAIVLRFFLFLLSVLLFSIWNIYLRLCVIKPKAIHFNSCKLYIEFSVARPYTNWKPFSFLLFSTVIRPLFFRIANQNRYAVRHFNEFELERKTTMVTTRAALIFVPTEMIFNWLQSLFNV